MQCVQSPGEEVHWVMERRSLPLRRGNAASRDEDSIADPKEMHAMRVMFIVHAAAMDFESMMGATRCRVDCGSLQPARS